MLTSMFIYLRFFLNKLSDKFTNTFPVAAVNCYQYGNIGLEARPDANIYMGMLTICLILHPAPNQTPTYYSSTYILFKPSLLRV